MEKEGRKNGATEINRQSEVTHRPQLPKVVFQLRQTVLRKVGPQILRLIPPLEIEAYFTVR